MLPVRQTVPVLIDARASECVNVEVNDPDRLLPSADLEWLAQKLATAAGAMSMQGVVSVRICDDAAMVAAHERYSRIAGTTDVLTFDLTDGPGEGPPYPLDAEILICFDEAARQTAERGHEVRRELLLYTIHGVLHCYGYDDHDKVSFSAMHRQEDLLLGALGVGSAFAGAPTGAGCADGGAP